MMKITVEKDGKQEVVSVHSALSDADAMHFEAAHGVDMRRGIAEYVGRELVDTIESVLKGER